ncbi:helix-turn-helix domain-containing protein [Nitrosomonas aestuarii]|uniref:helix-turn-helix domain-containing protein n=1 Tax=Nitrosomonas aestuarii TaxID=52441 RepID=UPI000D306B16|nr:helix-turn-helix domain-containing protein [Nitrosomonas aestuarii]
MKTLSLAEAAELLKMHAEEVRRRAKAGKIPGAKLGKSWVFILEDLVEYIRSHYADTWQALRVVANKEDKSCHSTNAVKRGGSHSPHRQESELDALLQQVIKPKRKNTTIS